jgi:hypothetical protein
MDFHEKHKADRARYEILTFHFGRSIPETIAALEPKLADLEKKWGRKFPFPILTDESQKTLNDWGIKAFPTAVLINPDGEIVMQENFGVEARLAEELKKPPAEKPKGEGEKPAPASRPKRPPPPESPKDDGHG